MKPIRVLIADDSPVAANVIATVLQSDPEISVVGIVKNGEEALRAVPKLKPDLITMDMHMPEMDGLEATKQIMAYYPTPILIVSSSVFDRGMEKVFQAMSYGALEVIDKSFFEGGIIDEKKKIEFLKKIRFLSRVHVVSHPLAKFEALWQQRSRRLKTSKEDRKIVGIVASTGGPQALQAILREIPKKFPVPIVIVQHITPGFTQGLVEWLGYDSKVQMKIAEHEESLKPGIAYIAPPGLQMRITINEKVSLTSEAAVDGQCPSGTILLQSLAQVYGRNALGVVLTGMGKDGAEGLKAIHQVKGFCIAQDEETSVVYGMPKEAAALKVVDEVLPLPDIASHVVKWVSVE